MGRLAAPSLALTLIMVSASLTLAPPARAEGSKFQSSAPEGFEDLESDRRLLLDVRFGGKKIGQALATIRPGALKFDEPGEVARLIPEVLSPDAVGRALAGFLPSNTALLCGPDRRANCGTLQPEVAGVILDEDSFAVEIFVNPSLLAIADERSLAYLPEPDGEPSLISLFGGTISGSTRGDRAYHLQNRSIASIGTLRLRSDSSLATGAGPSVDNLTLEGDRSNWRYLGGIFWAPGSELVGRRKVAGIGVTTQLDTLVDKEEATGTPLAVFLQQPGRVELLVDGRVVSSQIHSAGHRLIDTSALPNGSYDVVIRVQEDGRPARSERRFFTRESLMAPLGRPRLSAFAGFLQSNDRGFSLEHRTPFYQASASYRLTPGLGVQATLTGSQHKAILEGGTLLSTRLALVRFAGLVSSRGDVGAVLRAFSVGHGPLALSFDLKTVKSRDGGPLLPISSSGSTFSEDPEAGFSSRGTYTQGIATLDYRFRRGTFRLSGLYRKDASEQASYDLAASLELPVIRTGRLDLRLEADVRKSERDFSSFVGLRFLVTGGAAAVSGRAGLSRSGAPGGSAGFVAESQAGWYRQLSDQTQLSTDLAFGQDSEGAHVRGSSNLRSPLVNVRGDVLHLYGEGPNATQFTATADSGIVLGEGTISIGAREMSDSAAIVSVRGGDTGQTFEVLVDEVVRGSVANGESLALFLPPYRTYEIRLRSRDAQVASFETAPREATLFPGNVTKLDWEVTPLVVLFGRAVGARGEPVSGAEIIGPHGIGRTDEQGYFQIEASRSDILRFSRSGDDACTVAVPKLPVRDGYISAGEVLCR